MNNSPCTGCPLHGHGIPANDTPPRAAIACPILEKLGRWGWPCHSPQNTLKRKES